jgi:hypothetical protein
VVTVLGFGLAVVVGRVVLESRAELAQGEAALARGALDDAVTHLHRAARWYAPGSPYCRRALARLEQIADQAERGGDPARALATWRAVRGALLATRSFYTPHAAHLEPANQRIAALMAAVENPAVDPGRSLAERRGWHLDRLWHDQAPSAFWSVVALLGFAAWIGGALLFIFRGVDRGDRLRRRPAAMAGVVVAIGILFFFLGLARA